MKASILRLVGGALMILGCCALAFCALQVWLVWGKDQTSWPMEMPTLTRNLEFGAELFGAIGVGAIALGFWLRRLKGASRNGR